ncbi:Clavaminate synthase-like protein [Panaeolus papilionaceus]|nr:Clavaminate synthase-like protein [Panaeolus papilionaceus]
MTDLPPFPNDVETQDLLVIDWNLLEAGNEEEQGRLWEAATTWGFWYLKNYKAEKYVQGMFQMGKETLALPFEEKMNYWQGNKGGSAGYKVAGATYADVDGSTDVAEFINVAKDDALSYPTEIHRAYPPPVNEHMASTVKPFISSCVDMGRVILEVFNHKLGLPEGTLTELHRVDKQCISESRCIKVPPSKGVKIALGPHTDFGSLSLLVNRLGGLQVLAPSGSDGVAPEWKYVKPLPGHAICNVGDTLNILSGGILKSCVHRVVPPPGAQAEHERWSLVYFARPTNDVYLEPLVDKSPLVEKAASSTDSNINNPQMTAGQWFVNRQTQHRTDANKDASSYLIHGPKLALLETLLV